MKFLCLAYGDEAGWNALSDTEKQSALAQDAVIRDRGNLVAAVRPSVTSVRNWDGNLEVGSRSHPRADLPLAGFSVIEAASVEEVVGLVAHTPCARARGVIEIRPFWEAGDAPEAAASTIGTASAEPTTLERIAAWREQHRLEMACQITHDSIHDRTGWTHEYLLSIDDVPVGYGSVAVAGPWKDHPSVYEFYLVPTHRSRVFDLFRALLAVSRAERIEVQSNDALATVMLHTFAEHVTTESILFRHGMRTALSPAGATFREPTASEAPELLAGQRRWHGVVEVDGRVAATGGVLFHYNRPYGDIFMEVEVPFRRRGLGSYLVQELARVCYEGGHVPAARCRADNRASQQTLQKAGMVPCGNILVGVVQGEG